MCVLLVRKGGCISFQPVWMCGWLPVPSRSYLDFYISLQCFTSGAKRHEINLSTFSRQKPAPKAPKQKVGVFTKKQRGVRTTNFVSSRLPGCHENNNLIFKRIRLYFQKPCLKRCKLCEQLQRRRTLSTLELLQSSIVPGKRMFLMRHFPSKHPQKLRREHKYI